MKPQSSVASLINRYSRALALLAVLCLLGMQVMETNLSHSHSGDGTVAECLLCKSSADTVIAVPALAPLSLALVAIAVVFWAGIAPAAVSRPYDSRGPPRNS